jgi:glycopeptide antibiotics resistance protein
MLEGWIVYPPAAVLAAVLALRARRRGADGVSVAAIALLTLYLGWLAAAALFPLPVAAEARAAAAAGGERLSVQLVPLRGIGDLLASSTRTAIVWLVGGNVLVFVPFGLLAPVVWRRARTWGGVVLAGLVLSLGIETVQLGVSLLVGYAYRVTELDDVLLNVAGVLLGFGLFVLARPRLESC